MKTRGETIGTSDTVQLKVIFRNNSGVAVDLVAFPTIQISEPSGAIYLNYISTGVYRLDTGTYGYDFTVPVNGPQGIWIDSWIGSLADGTELTGSFNFIISNVPLSTPFDGYVELGDEPEYNLSQEAIKNINRLMKMLKVRLQSSGRHQTKDSYGNIVYENCNIFSTEELYVFLCSSLSEFNLMPHFTQFTFEESFVVDNFADILVEGGYIMALASKALIEKGREYNITDNGISFQPAATADFMNSQMGTLLGPYRDKLKNIKYQMKPAPLGLGTLRMTAIAPIYMNLRHRRSNRIV